MTPGAVRERLSALREAGEALRRRPGAEVVDVLASVLERWRDPEGPERRALERALPDAAGFSPAVVQEGLALALAPWNGDALRALARRELARGDDHARGHDTTAVLLAGSIPMPSLLGVIAPLAARSPVLVKTASRDPLTAHRVKESVAAIDADLARCIEVVDFPGDDAACTAAFLEADCIVATGSDETVEAVAKRAGPQRRVLRHGHRLSIAVLGPAAMRGGALADAARGIALDTALWDQLGCLSPVAVYARGDGPACRALGEALAEALADCERRLPRGRVDARAEALARHERSGAELRAAAGGELLVRSGAGGVFSVVVEADATPRPMPLHRFLRVHPIGGADELGAALAPLSRHLAGAAVAGFPEASDAPVVLGDARVCPPGALQCPPLGWRRDGLAPLGSLVRD